jgi:hypothetical protein
MIKWLSNIFKKKPIIIPLTTNGIENGTWIECYKNDKYYKVLVKHYGEPLPEQIEVQSLSNITNK